MKCFNLSVFIRLFKNVFKMFNIYIYIHTVFIGIRALINLCHSGVHMKISLKTTSEEGFWKFLCVFSLFLSFDIILNTSLLHMLTSMGHSLHAKLKEAGLVARHGDVQTPPWPLLSVRLCDNFLHSAHPLFFYCCIKLVIVTVVLLYL